MRHKRDTVLTGTVSRGSPAVTSPSFLSALRHDFLPQKICVTSCQGRYRHPRMNNGISIIIPTYNGGRLFRACLEKVREQEYDGPVQLIVIDSGSLDGTAELAEKAGALVKRISKARFHHARTRNEALSLTTFDKVVFTVQDAVPCSTTWLSDLENALDEHPVVAAYTDQVPHEDATPYARFENECIRDFRGQEPVLQGLDSVESFRRMSYHDAYRAIALDNVCAVYRKASLMDVPFPEVGFAEDLAWSLATMLKGERVLYQPAIKVKHSHSRPPEYGFHRQIVNSFWCAQIMGRVARDMSSLTLRDLLSLTSSARLVAASLHRSIAVSGGASVGNGDKRLQVTDAIVRKYSVGNKARWYWMERPSKDREDVSVALDRLREESGHDMPGLLEWMKTRGCATSGEALMEVLDQITALVLGRIYGEVYASHLITGTASRRLDAFMKPYLAGV
jgi:GT2 family glycosyltransferase